MDNGLFVALQGPPLRHLTAPAQTAQEVPHMCGVIVHANLHPNHGGDALQGPQRVGEAMGPGALQQQRQQLLARLVDQLAWPSRRRFGG